MRTAVTGTPFFHSDRAPTIALFPRAAGLYTAGDVQASAAAPLLARGRLLGCLSLRCVQPRPWSPEDQDLLAALTALTALTLERIAARDAERTASAAVARFSKILQRSLLTAPPEPDHLQIVVRYVPAAAQAQVGGDWYDAFLTSGGTTTSLVIGDVTGHDSRAAAAMGQMRNLLRGIVYALGGPPAEVLGVTDHAVHDLAVGAMATLVLAQVEQTPEQPRGGDPGAALVERRAPAAAADHPPTAPPATWRAPEPLLGLDPSAVRADHEVLLPPGAGVLLFTDGLVERRGRGPHRGRCRPARPASHPEAAGAQQDAGQSPREVR